MSGISNSAMLVELNISVWTGRITDKRVSDEIDARKQTKAKGGNYHKNLLAGSSELEKVGQIAAKVRSWHYAQTLPWSDGGARLLPTTNFFEYKEQLNKFQREFEQAVDTFVETYPTLISKAAFSLGALFSRDDYPRAEHIRTKFGFNFVFTPVPEAGDFRIDAEEAVRRELEAQYEEAYTRKINDAMKDAWERLYACLTHMSDRLADDEDGKHKIFRDSLVDNALEITQLLTRLNITGDTKLEQARQALEKALINVEPKDLREQPPIRNHVKARVDEILKRFEF